MQIWEHFSGAKNIFLLVAHKILGSQLFSTQNPKDYASLSSDIECCRVIEGHTCFYSIFNKYFSCLGAYKNFFLIHWARDFNNFLQSHNPFIKNLVQMEQL